MHKYTICLLLSRKNPDRWQLILAFILFIITQICTLCGLYYYGVFGNR